jgi:hypothetical protein
MDQNYFSTLLTAMFGIFVILLTIKTVLFFKATRRRSITNFVYFTYYDIVNTSGEERKKAKKVQNTLTISLAIYVAVCAITLLFIGKA